MTVAEAISVLKSAKKILIVWNGLCTAIDPDNELEMDAYGKYLVKRIENCFRKDEYEIQVAACPMKAEVQA